MNFGGPPPKIAARPPQIRVERTKVPKKPEPLPSKVLAQQKQQSRAPARLPSSNSKPSPLTPDRLEPRKRKATRQKSPAQQRLESDSDDDDVGSSASFDGFVEKRQKVGGPIDLKRKLRSRKAFSEDDDGVFQMIHAADIASSTRKSKSVTEVEEKNVTVELKYPSASQRERYDLVFGKEQIDPAQEICDISEIVTDVYLTEDQAKSFTDPNTGVLRKLVRAKNLLSKDSRNKELLEGFKEAVNFYNGELEELIKDGVFAQNLDNMHHIPHKMVHCILRQVYDRVVSPQVDFLKKKHESKDNTYGELLPPFVTKIFKETNLVSDQVFVDLGSGVGNVVLQAALQVGCESWGCEMMEVACNLAETQKKEFAARCRLWGIQTGRARLQRGDFRENDEIRAAMKRADVILVNNEVFGSDLNQDLMNMFLDLKEGCKIVSLKSFVPSDHKILERNINDPVNVLRVVQEEYYENFVSWKGERGSYFIATKDSKRLEKYGRSK